MVRRFPRPRRLHKVRGLRSTPTGPLVLPDTRHRPKFYRLRQHTGLGRSCSTYHHVEHLRPPHALAFQEVGSHPEALLQGKLKANKKGAVEAAS